MRAGEILGHACRGRPRPLGYPESKPQQRRVRDSSKPQSARIWNYWLGGKGNYPVDREAGDEGRSRIPDIADGARAERAFLVRVVRYLVGLLGVVNHIMDCDVAHSVVNRLVTALPSGSYLVLSHSTAEVHGEPMLEVMRQLNQRGGTPIRARTSEELVRFFDGMELLDPGVVSCLRWRSDPIQVGTRADVYLFGGMGRIR